MRNFLDKSFSYQICEVKKERVIMFRPTGAAAVNVEGTNINSAFSISPDRSYQKFIPN